jgi:multisubunit Na+/H+ antiporter MnhG subunit
MTDRNTNPRPEFIVAHLFAVVCGAACVVLAVDGIINFGDYASTTSNAARTVATAIAMLVAGSIAIEWGTRSLVREVGTWLASRGGA